MSVSGFSASLVQAICLSGACTQVEVASWQIQAAAALTHHSTQPSRPQRWSIFQGDGMVNVFFKATIAVNGFSIVLTKLDHHH